MSGYDIKKLFGQRVKNLRKGLDLTQFEVAERVNVDPKHISCIECGKNFPSPDILNKLAQTFKVHPKELFEFETKPSIEELKQEIIKNLDKAIDEEIEKIFIYSKFVTNH